MSIYLLIESRDPFESREPDYFYALAAGLAREGHAVTLFLVQNGVLAARAAAPGGHLQAALSASVDIRADDFSLRERGIAARELTPGVQAAPIDLVIDRMAEGHRVMWH